MKIYKKDDKIIIEINKYQSATDAIGEKVGEIDNVIGIAYQDEDGNQELGFSYLIDRTYKGAEPDISVPFLSIYMEKEEFIKLCQDIGIGYYEYPVCAYCGKDIHGSFTIGKKGDMCWDCEYKLNKK